VQLAYVANQLPWESKRALQSLNDITKFNVGDANQLVRALAGDIPRELGVQYVRRWLRPLYSPRWPESWRIACPAAATSYLTQFEYRARSPVHELFRVYCDWETCRRAALTQIGLAIFRLDHGSYPDRLSELVPDYLEQLPLDPYSRQPFQYEPKGLDRPLENWTGSATNLAWLRANTPFLWSVGPGNARLRKMGHTRWTNNPSDPDGKPVEVHEFVYALTVEEQPWWGETSFVFPLTE
jgi:hypothetical protein